MVKGGRGGNVIAREGRFGWDRRNLPEDDAQPWLDRCEGYCRDEVLPEMRRSAPEANIVTRNPYRTPSLKAEPGSAADALVRALTGDNDTGVVSYGTEAGQFQAAGFSTIICGPGSIDQAHQPNEFIERSQVDLCTKTLRRLIALQAAGT